MSEPKGVTCEVPQCSILGPLLFLLYVNDMASAVRCKLLLYADDSALIKSNQIYLDTTSLKKMNQGCLQTIVSIKHTLIIE